MMRLVSQTSVACRPFHLLAIPRLRAFHTGDRGWGIRADQFIPAGTFVVEYTGTPFSPLLLWPAFPFLPLPLAGFLSK